MSRIFFKYKVLIIVLLFATIAFFGFYILNRTILPNYRFEHVIAEASKIPDIYWDEKYQDMKISNKYKVVLVSADGGEYSYVENFKYVADKMGWEVQVYYNQILGHEKESLAFDHILYL